MANTLDINGNVASTIGEIVRDSVFKAQEKYYRDGIELEKGVVLTEERINKNRKLYESWANYFTAYPDAF